METCTSGATCATGSTCVTCAICAISAACAAMPLLQPPTCHASRAVQPDPGSAPVVTFQPRGVSCAAVPDRPQQLSLAPMPAACPAARVLCPQIRAASHPTVVISPCLRVPCPRIQPSLFRHSSAAMSPYSQIPCFPYPCVPLPPYPPIHLLPHPHTLVSTYPHIPKSPCPHILINLSPQASMSPISIPPYFYAPYTRAPASSLPRPYSSLTPHTPHP